MRLYLKSLLDPGYTGNLDYIDDMVNNSTFFIINMKHFSIDHNSSSVNSCQILIFHKVL